MRTAIIASKKDPAGMNILNSLKNLDLTKYDAEIYEIQEELIYVENIDKKIKSDIFIFASHHQSKEGIHSLSCHAPGNWGKAEAGGIDNQLCFTNAVFLKEIFLLLNQKNTLKEFQVTMECTHHGPYLEKPCFFIEIGSDAEQWNNQEAGSIIAEVIIEFLKRDNDFKEYEVAVALGGTHYLATLNKIQLNSNIAIGHTCPKHQLQNLNRDMLLQAMEKTIPKPDFVLLDWKGLGKEKQRILKIIEELKIKRSDKL